MCIRDRQNKALLEATEKISDKVECIRGNVELALEVNSLHISECKARVGSIEEWVQGQATTISEFVSEQEHQFEELTQQINRLQRTCMPASQTTYVYKYIDEPNSQPKFFGHEADNPLQFLRACERNMEAVNNILSEVDKINWVVLS